jgi:hypothetical protein
MNELLVGIQDHDGPHIDRCRLISIAYYGYLIWNL